MPIDTPEDLRDHLELAIQIELSTIPPYLYAMYSIADQTSQSALLLRSIVVEEMLHAALVTNLLLATGGSPDFASTKYMTPFPCDLPHHDPPLRVDLAACSDDQIRKVFMRIEQPELHDAPAQPDQYETLGQFYHAIELAIEDLSASHDLFSNPQLDAQLSDSRFYRPVDFDAEDSGGLMPIEDRESAVEAIEVIVHQGEGLSDDRWADPSHQELTHYWKLVQIAEGTTPIGEVRPVGTNPKTVDYPEHIRPASDLFNAIFRGLFLVLNRIFDGVSDQGRSVGVLYILMADVLSQLAAFLVAQPIGDNRVAAPTFEIFEFRSDQPLEETIAIAREAARLHPQLSTVHEALRGLGFIL
jgi:hypothetical protein